MDSHKNLELLIKADILLTSFSLLILGEGVKKFKFDTWNMKMMIFRSTRCK